MTAVGLAVSRSADDLSVCITRTCWHLITFPGAPIFGAIWLPTCTPGAGLCHKTVQYQFPRVAVARVFCVISPQIQLQTDIWPEKWRSPGAGACISENTQTRLLTRSRKADFLDALCIMLVTIEPFRLFSLTPDKSIVWLDEFYD
jgi:hypothetical protein